LSRSFLQILQDRLGAGVHVQLFIDVLEMIVNGPDTDAESAGDFFVQESLAHMVQDFLLAGGQTWQSGWFIARTTPDETLKVVPDLKRNFTGGQDPLSKRAANWFKQIA